MKNFFVSLAYIPEQSEEPEVIQPLRIRTRKNNYLHVPTQHFKLDSRKDFENKMMELTEAIWDHIEKYG